MRMKRKAAAGLCILMLAQTCVPAEMAWAETGRKSQAEVSLEGEEKENDQSREETETEKKREAEETLQPAEEAQTKLEMQDEEEPGVKKSTEAETTEPETTEKGNARRSAEAQARRQEERSSAEEEEEGGSQKEKTRERSTEAEEGTNKEEEETVSAETEAKIQAEADPSRGQVQYVIQLTLGEQGTRLQIPVPEGMKAAGIEVGEEETSGRNDPVNVDWTEEDGVLECVLDDTSAKEAELRIRWTLDEDQMKSYMESGEGAEISYSPKARILDSEGQVLFQTKGRDQRFTLEPFLKKEAEPEDRAQRTFVWTDWVNLAVNPGGGYLAVVIEDLEKSHYFDAEDSQVILLDEEGQEIETKEVVQVTPQKSGVFGEIFTAEDARALLGEETEAGFYTYTDDEGQEDGILLISVDERDELTGISYVTNVSLPEQPETYQWDVELQCGSKFLWEPAISRGLSAEAKDEETEKAAAGEERTELSAPEGEDELVHPQWELLARRISEEKDGTQPKLQYSAKAVWLKQEARCSLVSQSGQENGYDRNENRADWDLLINQNGEDLLEAVITRSLPEGEQTFGGAAAQGKPIEIQLYAEGKEFTQGDRKELPAYAEWEEGSEEEPEGFYGYYVLNQEQEPETLELHLFQLGREACKISLETQVKDEAFAAGSQEFVLPSGDTEYTAVLRQEGGEIVQTQGSCPADIPAENQWITLEAAEEYDYEDHSILLEMMVNPQERSLRDQEVTVTLTDGLEQAVIEEAQIKEDGKTWEEITDLDWIAVEETEPDEQTGERQVSFKWNSQALEEENISQQAQYKIRFRCRMSQAVRDESFFTSQEETLFAAASLTGLTGEGQKGREITGAESEVSIEWNSAAAAGEGTYLESRYSQENSRWKGTRMPRVDWKVVINRHQADLTGAVFAMEWPDKLAADPESLRIVQTELKKDGSLGEERLQLWPAAADEEGKEEETPFQEDQIQITPQGVEIELPEEAGEQTICLEITAFAEADMTENEFSGSYRLERKGELFEEGELSVAGGRQVSILEAARKNQIPSAAVLLASENSAEKEPYRLSGASFRLTKMKAEGEETEWKSYKEEGSGKGEDEASVIVSAVNGQALFLFLEEDILYKIEETESVPGYDAWDTPRYLVLLRDKTEKDFPQEDEDHPLFTGENQILMEETMELSRSRIQSNAETGGLLEFYVEDQEGEPLAGLHCSLTYVNYTASKSSAGRLKSKQAESGEDGLVRFEGLDPVREGEEGYEIHVTAPYGMEDPAEFSASVIVQDDGSFLTEVKGTAAREQDKGIVVTCLPAVASIQIPVTDQNGNLMAGCGLELQVERLEEVEEEEKDTGKEERLVSRYVSYDSQPKVSEDGTGYLRLADLPYGTYRIFGGRAILTLIIDDEGVEGWLEPVEAESESEERKAVRLELEANEKGIYEADEKDGWYMEEYIPPAEAEFVLTVADGDGGAIQGSRFLVYETWSDRLVAELKEGDEPGTYHLAPSSLEDAWEENDRGYAYLKPAGDSWAILPGTYAVWEVEAAEGFEDQGDGVWYFQVGEGVEIIGNQQLTDGEGREKPFANEIIRRRVSFQTVWDKQSHGEDSPEINSKTGQEEPVEESLTVRLEGTALSGGAGAQDYVQEITCPAGQTGEFQQVPVGIYILQVQANQETELQVSGPIQVQVQYDGEVVFRTIGGRSLEKGEFLLQSP